jgi:hypothetical protein
MPTRKPRLALTVSEELQAALIHLGEAAGKPAATIAAQILEDSIPQLVDLAKLHRAVNSNNPALAKRALQQMLGNNMAEVMAMQQPELFGKPKAKAKK